MATAVYQSGKNIIVDKNGETTLTIVIDRGKYTVFYPFYSTDGLTPDGPEDIRFSDTFFGTSITDKISEVTDQNGTSYDTLTSLINYLSTVFERGDGAYVTKEGATSENQKIIIAQNTDIEENTKVTSEKVRDLDNIKKELKINNKQLKKINN
jgi:hypothetical protein